MQDGSDLSACTRTQASVWKTTAEKNEKRQEADRSAAVIFKKAASGNRVAIFTVTFL